MKLLPTTKIFYINLDDDLKRKENIERIIDKLQFVNAERVPAVNTKSRENLDKYKDLITADAYEKLINNNSRKYRDNHYELSNGAVGCYLSHTNVYKKIVNNNIDYAIILEDDCAVENNYNSFWNIISNLELPDSDIILFGVNDFDKTTSDDTFKKINFFFGLHFYIVTLQGAKNILDNVFPIEVQIDTKLARLSYLNKINIYRYNKSDLLIKQNGSTTNIQVLKCPLCNIYDEINLFMQNNKIESMANLYSYDMDSGFLPCKNCDIYHEIDMYKYSHMTTNYRQEQENIKQEYIDSYDYNNIFVYFFILISISVLIYLLYKQYIQKN